MPRTNRRDLLLGAGAGAALLTLPRAVRAAPGDKFRVGALNPITGSGSTFGSGMQKMIEAAAVAVNAAGGAAGMQIEVVGDDTQTSPQAGVLAAKKMLDIEKVHAILGTWSSGVTLAVIPLTNAADVILMSTSGAPALSVPPANAKGLSFRFQATNPQFGQAFAEVCKREGFKRPATMAFNNASGIGNAEGFTKAWEAHGGKVVASVVYEPNQTSYNSELQKILDAKPDVIVTGSYLADTTIIMREWYQSGIPVKWILPGWAGNPDLIKAVGAEPLEGVISVDSVSNADAPSYKLYDAAYQKAMGQPGATNVYAAMAWDMMVTLALALEAAGKPDTAALKEHVRMIANPPGQEVYSYADGMALLKQGKKINYQGASSRLDFDEHGDVTPDFGVSFIESGKLVRKYVVKI
jgi:branched-chain amino acid transport system substrate-binding protein